MGQSQPLELLSRSAVLVHQANQVANHPFEYLAQVRVAHADRCCVFVAHVLDLSGRLSHPGVGGPVKVRASKGVEVECTDPS
jgi:hypothetical protein